jgi:hypothetical protein
VTCQARSVFLWSLNGTLLASRITSPRPSNDITCCLMSEGHDWLFSASIIATGHRNGAVKACHRLTAGSFQPFLLAQRQSNWVATQIWRLRFERSGSGDEAGTSGDESERPPKGHEWRRSIAKVAVLRHPMSRRAKPAQPPTLAARASGTHNTY